MSGAEVIAIIGCVAGLIQAYDAASRIVKTIKKKRRERSAPPPSEFLEDAIDEGKKDVERLLEKGQRRFGPTFQVADDAITLSLYKTTIEIQNALLRCFAQFLDDEDINDFETVVYALEHSRTQAASALERLYSQKLDETAQARRSTLENEYAQSPSPQPAVQPRRSQATLQAPSRQTTFDTLPEAPFERRANTSDSPRLRHLEVRTNTSNGPVLSNEDRTARVGYPTGAQSASSRFSRDSSATNVVLQQRRTPTMTPADGERTRDIPSLQLGGMDNQSVRNYSSYSASNRESVASLESPSLLSASMTSPRLSPSRSRGDSIKTLSRTPPSPASSTNFCKYAERLWFGVPADGLKADGPYFNCKSKKCGFSNVPAKKSGSKWVIDTDLRSCFDISYRPLFLAKSHVPTPEGKPPMYRCLVCWLQKIPSDNFDTHKDLFSHIDQHRGAPINGVSFRGSLVFEKTMRAGNEHVFDIRLPPRRGSSTTPVSPSISRAQTLQQEEELPQYEATSAPPPPFAMDDDTNNPWAAERTAWRDD